MKITERIYDATTGKTTDVERTLSGDELAEYELGIQQAKEAASKQAEAIASRAAAEAKLAKLGLTTDDLKALGL
jgi:hypothetical protein